MCAEARTGFGRLVARHRTSEVGQRTDEVQPLPVVLQFLGALKCTSRQGEGRQARSWGRRPPLK